PTPAGRALISALAPAVARAVDPLQSVAAVAGIVGGAHARIGLARSGNTLALSRPPAPAPPFPRWARPSSPGWRRGSPTAAPTAPSCGPPQRTTPATATPGSPC